MEITTFAGGLVTNVAEHAPRGREAYAAHCRNCRSDEQGWLVPRKGMVSISDEDGFSEVFVYQSVALAVQNSRLRWARLQADPTTPLTFQDFNPAPVTILRGGAGRITFKGSKEGEGDGHVVWISAGADVLTVRIPDALTTPTVSLFYLPKPTLSVTNQDPAPPANADTVALRVQFVTTNGSGDITDSDNARAIERKDSGGDARATTATISQASDAVEVRLENDGITNFQFQVSGAFVGEVEYVDLFRTEVNGDPDGDYYFIERIPYSTDVNATFSTRYSFEFDTSMPVPRLTFLRRLSSNHNDIFQPFLLSAESRRRLTSWRQMVYGENDNPSFNFITSNEFRNYVARGNTQRVYISYYNPGTNEKFFQLFPDYIDLDLGGGSITGLAFIRDNLLVVYSTNQIYMIQTDPVLELHNVIDVLGPRDGDGNLIGCIAPDTIVDMGGEHFFLGTNKYVYRFDGRSVRSISDSVHAIFQEVPIHAGVSVLLLSKATAFSFDKDYYISIPTGDSILPTTTLVYETMYRRWWQDDFGVNSLSKRSTVERLYAVIAGRLFVLYEGTDDAGTPIRRVWRSNPSLRRTHDIFRSVHVYAMDSAEVNVLAKTEQGEETGTLTVARTADVFSQRFGVNLRGRNFTVEISTVSDAPIDRILVNELFWR